MRRITVPTVEAGHAIGVDLGGTKILAGVVARDGRSSAATSGPTPQDSQDTSSRELEAAVAELLDDVGGGGRLRRAVPDRPGGRRRRPLRQPAARELRRSATACASGSAFRSGSTTTRTRPRSASGGPAPGRGVDDLVMLTLGTGVGGGVISGGKPVPRPERRRAPSSATS